MSYLYLLVDAEGDAFKIGVSINPEQRMVGLPEDFDRSRSMQFKCDVQEVYKTEKALHFLFRKHKAEKSFGSGYTEWFAISCFDDVKTFIHNNQMLLGWVHCEPIPAPRKADKVTTGYNAMTKEEKARVREENKQKRHQEYVEHNAKCLAVVGEWLGALRSQGVLVGKFSDEKGNRWIAIATEEQDRMNVLPSEVKAYSTMDHSCGGFHVFGAFRWLSEFPLTFIPISIDDPYIERLDGYKIKVPLLSEMMQLLDGVPDIPAEQEHAIQAMHTEFEASMDNFWRDEIVGKVRLI